MEKEFVMNQLDCNSLRILKPGLNFTVEEACNMTEVSNFHNAYLNTPAHFLFLNS